MATSSTGWSSGGGASRTDAKVSSSAAWAPSGEVAAAAAAGSGSSRGDAGSRGDAAGCTGGGVAWGEAGGEASAEGPSCREGGGLGPDLTPPPRPPPPPRAPRPKCYGQWTMPYLVYWQEAPLAPKQKLARITPSGDDWEMFDANITALLPGESGQTLLAAYRRLVA